MRKRRGTTVKEAALRLAERGFAVFPLRPRGRSSYKTQAQTGTPWGSTRDPAVIDADFTRWPRANLSVVTGRVSGIFVTDEDTLEGHGRDGLASMRALEARHDPLPPTLAVRTPSGGRHLYWTLPTGWVVRNSSNRLGDGIDVRGEGGMVLAPPSRRGRGEYEWVDEDAEVADPPTWLLESVAVREEDDGERRRQGDLARAMSNRPPVDDAELAAAVAAVPNPALGWEEWNRVALAIFRATDGSDLGLELLDEWSQKCPQKYTRAGTLQKWTEMIGTPPTEIGVGTIMYLADQADPTWRKAHQARDALRSAEEAVGDDPDQDQEIGGGDPGEADGPRSGGKLSLSDFWASHPDHLYIYVPTGAMWPPATVNSKFGKIPVLDASGRPVVDEEKGKPKMVPAAQWLDVHRGVQQILWSPAEPRIVPDKHLVEGGWVKKRGAQSYNMYRPPPRYAGGDASRADPWLDHLKKLYPQDWGHILLWMAHRVQRPGEKVNHSLVLLGDQGIGKDSLLEPLKRAIGPWNFADISPKDVLSPYSGYLQSVVVRINEARDLGDVNRYQFYESTKIMMAAPPDVLRVNEKYIRERAVQNCCGVIVTTNRKDSLYLPDDDRRHFVCYSDLSREDYPAGYWTELWSYYDRGGFAHVAAHLRELDISEFDAKAPPPKTEAFWEIVEASKSGEHSEVQSVLGLMGDPPAVTVRQIVDWCGHQQNSGVWASLYEWLTDRKNRKSIPRVLAEAGYAQVRNPGEERGRWAIDREKTTIYGRSSLPARDRLRAAQDLTRPREPEVGGTAATVTPIERAARTRRGSQ